VARYDQIDGQACDGLKGFTHGREAAASTDDLDKQDAEAIPP
jgi:hypothetical protein